MVRKAGRAEGGRRCRVFWAAAQKTTGLVGRKGAWHRVRTGRCPICGRRRRPVRKKRG